MIGSIDEDMELRHPHTDTAVPDLELRDLSHSGDADPGNRDEAEADAEA